MKRYSKRELVIAREIGDRRGEAIRNWNLGFALESVGRTAEAVEAMETCVAYERQIGHPDAEQHTAQVEALRRKAKG